MDGAGAPDRVVDSAAQRSGVDVTIAVLNYNGRALLEAMLPSVLRQSIGGFALHVIDDCSTDDSLEYLAACWPTVKIHASDRNLGVTASMVRAIHSAETPYVALLNNDVELGERWLEEMLDSLRRRPQMAAADGKLLQFHRRDRLDGAGDSLEGTGHPYRRGQGEQDRGQFDTEEEVFCATGGAALFRRSAFDTVGDFDEEFFAYYEDVDWGFRARLVGMGAIFVPTAVAFHVGSATTGANPVRYAHLLVRNQIVLVLKNFPAMLLMRYLPRILLFELRWFAFDIKHGLGGPHLRGFWEAIKAIPSTLRKRQAIQRSRTVSNDALRRLLT